MDELDRLYRRLLGNIRSAFPELEARSFEVAQIYQQIVPYRSNRQELGFASNDEYELALMQLLAGTRGLVTGEAEMQEAIRAELDAPNPDLSAYRAYGTCVVALAPEASRRVSLAGAAVRAWDASNAPTRTPSESAALASRKTDAVHELAADAPAPPVHAPVPAAPGRTASAVPAAPIQAHSQVPAAPALDTTALGSRTAPASSPSASSMPLSRPAPIRTSAGEKCRYCSGGLPEGRPVVFCPSCGHNLTVQHCPACSTELEVGWKFCITCGRDTR